MKPVIGILIIICFLELHCCEEIPPPKLLPIEESLFNLTVNLHRAKSNNDSTENLVFSPLGFNLLLGQISAGANPVLKEAIGKFLGWEKAKLTDIHEHHEHLLQSYNGPEGDGASLKIHINSALFYRDYIKIFKDFETLLEKHYASQLITLPDKATEAENQQIVNLWVQNATEDLIKDFPISSNTISLFANVVYFTAEWLEPFSDQLTRSGQFFTTPKITNNATYLMGQQEIFYMENHDLDFKMIRLPYNSTKYNISMYILSPQKHNLEDIVAGMTLNKFLNYKSLMTIKTVNIKMPKLSLKSKIHLRDTLSKLIENSSNPKDNTFALNKMSNNSRTVLSDVVQESTFNVYEKGTTFASLTAGYINYDGTARNCRVDKPYLAIILDESTNIVLFWASIYQPTI